MVLGIYGSGGLGREVLDLAQGINDFAGAWDKIVFIDDFKKQSVISGSDVFTFDDFQAAFPTDAAKIVIAVGEPKVRQILREKTVQNGYELQTIIHPTAFVGSKTQIGNGVIVQFGCFVSCNVKIDDNVLLQANSNIGHDCVIGNDTVISSFVTLAGNCKIEERVYIGMSVPVREGISIGADSIVGMGSVILRNIPANVIAMGNPARPMKNNEDGRVFK